MPRHIDGTFCDREPRVNSCGLSHMIHTIMLLLHGFVKLHREIKGLPRSQVARDVTMTSCISGGVAVIMIIRDIYLFWFTFGVLVQK